MDDRPSPSGDQDSGFASMPYTKGAQWLPPSMWPSESKELFTPREFHLTGPFGIITKYDQVLQAMLDRSRVWSREVPLAAIPPEMRHCTLGASWGTDNDVHRKLRHSLSALTRGSTAQAREFTRGLTDQLLTQLMGESQPWDLARVIYEVSMRVIIEHTLQAPPLLRHARRLRELTRDHVAAAGGFTGITRQLEAEEILGSLLDQRIELPEGGLARYLVDLHLQDPPGLSRDQVISQLWLLVVSHETQATATASLLGMVLEYGEFLYARSIIGQAEPMRLLIAEGGRRSIVFPASMLVPTRPVTLDGLTLDGGTPCLASYAAANLDEDKFINPLHFDPRTRRATRHLAFGEGSHRCQGDVGAEQFVEDVLTTLLRGLPERAQLHNSVVLRETGISMSIARLPITVDSMKETFA